MLLLGGFCARRKCEPSLYVGHRGPSHSHIRTYILQTTWPNRTEEAIKDSVWSSSSDSGGDLSIHHETHKTARQKVFVVCNLQNNRLGLPAITALHLACQTNETSNIHKRFTEVFNGLGSPGEEYTKG